jgi:hypothetical protein
MSLCQVYCIVEHLVLPERAKGTADIHPHEITLPPRYVHVYNLLFHARI